MELASRRAVWGVQAAVLAPFTLFFVVAGLVLLALGVRDAAPPMLLGGLMSVAAAVICIFSLTCGVRLARASPGIVVSEDALVLEHPGVFRRPVHLDRALIHSVYVRDFPAVVARPKTAGSPGRRLRSWVRNVDRGVGAVARPLSSARVPDLSTRLPAEGHNLLIVLARPTDLAASTRRGLAAMSAASLWLLYEGPTKGTVARGFFARVDDESSASRCLSSWATSGDPSPELWRWLHARKGALRRG